VASITPRVRFRQLPEPYTYPDSPPSSPAVVNLCHPANGLAFLALPAYDLFCQSPLQFGIHHETLTACCIIAYNKPGYLSTSRNRGAALDSIIPAAGEYYYHLNDPSDRFYSICCNFNAWKFSHGHLPPSWVAKSPCAPSFCILIGYLSQSILVRKWDNVVTIPLPPMLSPMRRRPG
jgi:hypothetical protein